MLMRHNKQLISLYQIRPKKSKKNIYAQTLDNFQIPGLFFILSFLFFGHSPLYRTYGFQIAANFFKQCIV
jgi:ribonucleotide reductase beta subunit family protein with ferritin-like domain